MKKNFLFFVFGGLFFVFLVFEFCSPVSAAFNFYISDVNPKEVFSKEQEIEVKVVVESLPISSDSFFRVSIKKGNSFVGYMMINNEWVKMGSLSSDKENNLCTRYYKVNSDGVYDFRLKIGSDVEIANGEYIVKVHRFPYNYNGSGKCGDYDSSEEQVEFKVNVILPTPSPTPAPTQSSTSYPSASSATVKISQPKDQNGGDILGSLKIYIDGSYVDKSAPKTYTFGDGKTCGSNNVPCGFGTHTFKVEKTGYLPWVKTADITVGSNYEFDPVLILASPSPTPTIKSSPTATASATPKSTPVDISTSTASGILAEDVFSNESVLGAESIEKTPQPEENISADPKLKAAALFFITAGVSFLGSAVYAYIRSKNKKGKNEEKSDEVEEESDENH